MLIYQRYKKFKRFLGPKVFTLLLLSIATGLLWFAIESSFIFVLQGFIYSLGLVPKAKLILPDWYPTSTIATSIILLTFGLFRAIGAFFNSYLAQRSQQAFMRIQRQRLLSYMFNNFNKISPNEGISIFTEIIGQSGNFIAQFAQLMITITTAICLFILGLRFAPKEMIIGVTLLALLLYPIRHLSRRIGSYGQEMVNEWQKTNKTLLFGFKNYFFVKLHGLIEQEVKKGSQSLQNYENHYRKYSILAGFNGAFPQFAGLLIISILSFLGIRFFNTSGIKLISFFYIFIRMSQSASTASTTLSNLRLSLPGFKKLFAWDEKAKEFHESQEKGSPPSEEFYNSIKKLGVEVKVKDLNFSYDTTPIIKNLSFSLKKGEPLLIKGESGTGKSTLLSLLTGLLTPNQGEITFNNEPINKIKDNLPNLLGYVGPDPYIFEGTVRENLLYGNPLQVPDETINNTLKLVQLDNSLDQELHEFTQLSTGQKQRLAIARALLRDPKILILDEATANLDKDTEDKIIDSLEKIKGQTTVVIISHKNSFDNFAKNQLHL